MTIVFRRIVVPTTGSDPSWRAVRVGDALAARFDAELEIYSVVPSFSELPDRGELLKSRLVAERLSAPTVMVTVEIDRDTVATTIAAHLAAVGRALPVMATAAHGRSEAILGSVAEELLALTCGPVVMVGPRVSVERYEVGHDLVVPVDGSERSEAALWPATAFSLQLGMRPWITSVVHPSPQLPSDTIEASYPAHLASRLRVEIHRDVEFEVLHGEHPAAAILTFTETIGASFVVASTHGRTGLARVALGSVATAIVHDSPCPVVLVNPIAPVETESAGAAHVAIA